MKVKSVKAGEYTAPPEDEMQPVAHWMKIIMEENGI